MKDQVMWRRERGKEKIIDLKSHVKEKKCGEDKLIKTPPSALENVHAALGTFFPFSIKCVLYWHKRKRERKKGQLKSKQTSVGVCFKADDEVTIRKFIKGAFSH